MKLASALLAVTLLIPAAASAQDIAGKWTANYPTRVRMTNGSAEAEEMGTAFLILEVKGDSVFGTWHPQNTPNPANPRKIAGTFINGKLSFVGEPTEARVRRSYSGGGEDEESPIKMTTYFEGTLIDGAIEGTYYSTSEDQSIRSRPLKWSARKS